MPPLGEAILSTSATSMNQLCQCQKRLVVRRNVALDKNRRGVFTPKKEESLLRRWRTILHFFYQSSAENPVPYAMISFAGISLPKSFCLFFGRNHVSFRLLLPGKCFDGKTCRFRLYPRKCCLNQDYGFVC